MLGIRMPSKAFWALFAFGLMIHSTSRTASSLASKQLAGKASLAATRGLLSAHGGVDMPLALNETTPPPGESDPYPCELVDVNAAEDACLYVTENCPPESLIDYYNNHFCLFADIQWLSYVLLIVWLLVIFVWLGTVADDFFVQNLRTIATQLRMSENMAGVTFLALGNGAPDLFGSYAAIQSDTPMLALGQLLGAGVFVTTVVVGVIGLQVPFKVNRRPFIRDVGFYLLGLSYVLLIVLNESINAGMSIVFILLYLLYILVVIVGRYVYQRNKASALQSSKTGINNDSYEEIATSSSKFISDRNPYVNAEAVVAAQKMHMLVDERTGLLSDSSAALVPVPEDDDEFDHETPTLVDLLFPAVRRWRNMSIFAKLVAVVAAPISFFLALTVPMVNPARALHGWNRPLATLQMIIVPFFAVCATATGFNEVGALAAWMIALIVGAGCAVIVFFTSKNHVAPVYFPAFAFLGFGTAALWIYTISGELVGVLLTMGRLFSISDALLGLTVLAWGNSLGDLVANPAIARKGYPGIGVSACFGGPLLNLLLGLGIAFTARVMSYEEEWYPLPFEKNLYVLIPGLYISLIMSLTVIIVNKFSAGRKYAMVLIAYYICFLVTNIVVEFQLI